MASSLAVGAPVYLETLNRLSLDTAFARTTDHFLKIRTYVPFVPLREADLDGADETFGDIRESSLSDVGKDVVRHLRTDAMFLGTPVFPLPITRPPSDAPRGYFQVLSDLGAAHPDRGGQGGDGQDRGGGRRPDTGGGRSGAARQLLQASDRGYDSARPVGGAAGAGLRQGDRVHRAHRTRRDPYWPLGANLFRVGPRSDDAAFQIDRASSPRRRGAPGGRRGTDAARRVRLAGRAARNGGQGAAVDVLHARLLRGRGQGDAEEAGPGGDPSQGGGVREGAVRPADRLVRVHGDHRHPGRLRGAELLLVHTAPAAHSDNAAGGPLLPLHDGELPGGGP